MKRAWRSLSSILGVVPEEMSAWKPETAPQAMVMNRNGNRLPDHTGPLPCANCVTAGICSVGITNTMPMASAMMVPIFKKADR
ncbi:Uncharacterised protein [Mycobacterium tuberculosis]|nr:Uncharacterised protein [Mycobacterium tuberculosis]